MERYSAVVIGGGAAGICAAISKARKGESVIICEKMPQLGKKVLASGNGRCNLLNDNMSEAYYNSAAAPLVKSIFAKCGKSAILDFFRALGLQVYSKEGRIFPSTNQASSVLKVLEMELKRLAVPVEYNFTCSGISFSRDHIAAVSAEGKKIECRKVIIAGGGRTYPAYGSDGSLYEVAKSLGHTLVEPVPAVVPLASRDNLCQNLQGQRIQADARCLINNKAGTEVQGELLFTKYGLSGTCILDISEEISIALHRQHRPDVTVIVDMVPFMDKDQLRNELEKRSKAGWSPEEMLVGILPNKFGPAFKGLWGKKDFQVAVDSLKEHRFIINGTRGWNEAEFTSGGIALNEIKLGTLESKLKPGVYFAGEILDVNGKRGGYNLGWAWASGLVAGQTG